MFLFIIHDLAFCHTSGNGIFHRLSGCQIFDRSYALLWQNIQLSRKVIGLRYIYPYHILPHIELFHILIGEKTDNPYIIIKHINKYSFGKLLFFATKCLKKIFYGFVYKTDPGRTFQPVIKKIDHATHNEIAAHPPYENDKSNNEDKTNSWSGKYGRP